MSSILLDTNIWLDYHTPARAGHTSAFLLLDKAHNAGINLLIASHSLKDFWYLYWQTGKQENNHSGDMGPEAASKSAKRASWAATQQIAEIATVVASDASDAWLSIKMQGTHDDYEDNLVVAAAMRAKPRLLVTNDQTLLAHCPVACATAADAISFLDLS
ncbi:MAG: PIN domain-containing protein [Eggerthellaceae bacterium]|nr:PIN domain-containing protein [Eggerthellaceae bacterium]